MKVIYLKATNKPRTTSLAPPTSLLISFIPIPKLSVPPKSSSTRLSKKIQIRTYKRSTYLICIPQMVNDAVFRSSLAWLAAIVLLVGLYTQSFKKMLATYVFGMFAISGVLLPDWEYFERSVSEWFTPLTVDEKRSLRSAHNRSATTPTRFKIYPIRLAIYTVVYGFAFYKWWRYVFN